MTIRERICHLEPFDGPGVNSERDLSLTEPRPRILTSSGFVSILFHVTVAATGSMDVQ